VSPKNLPDRIGAHEFQQSLDLQDLQGGFSLAILGIPDPSVISTVSGTKIQSGSNLVK
jgi:hypothetical protein